MRARTLSANGMGRQAGTLGSVGVFSFQSSKHLSTGDGGIAVTERSVPGGANARHHHVWRRADAAGPQFPHDRNDRRRRAGAVAPRPFVCWPGPRERPALCGSRGGLCAWLRPQQASPDSVHSYHLWVAAFAPQSGRSQRWRNSRPRAPRRTAAFSFGYVGVPAYLHPVFSLGGSFGVSRAPQSQPLPYRRGWCPVAESLMPRLMITGVSARDGDFHRRNAVALQRAVQGLS